MTAQVDDAFRAAFARLVKGRRDIRSLPPDAVGGAFIAYLCVGRQREASDTPERERAGWERRAGPEHG